MKKALLLCALGAAAAVLAATPARADSTFDLTFNGCLGGGIFCLGGTPISDAGNVTFTIASDPSTPSFGVNEYDITSISGSVDIGGKSYTITGLSNNLGGDDDLFVSSLGNYYFDAFGLDFTLSGSGTYNELKLFNFLGSDAEGQSSYTYRCGYKDKSTCTGENQSFGLSSQDITLASETSPTPEPGSLALLGTSILGAAGLLRRRILGRATL